jgi:hypothetical protein
MDDDDQRREEVELNGDGDGLFMSASTVSNQVTTAILPVAMACPSSSLSLLD